ncbi:Xaa-Pro peptidase family protein [Sphingomonas sp.]|uniref:M24 family metallopeptidase n=1 Tax=Sphingomonas sp. TaxID=28214 RepID=UPI00286C113C|nr:Xaa-Pro peptidase family protein [Sphingomonas sp.]
MKSMVSRRHLLQGTGALAGAALLSGAGIRAATAAVADLTLIPLPPPIDRAERLRRLAKARSLMKQNGIGSILVESGPSLDYFTGVQWWRSERLTAAVIPAEGEPIIVTPFFERPSVAESLGIPAEIRTWNEDEEPLKLVADFLRERGIAKRPVGFEETNRFFILDRLLQQLKAVNAVNANRVVRGCRMFKSPAELGLMQAANDIMLASLRFAGERTREGMTPADIDAMIASVHKTMGSDYAGGLVLIGESSAYPHGSHKPQLVKRGDVILMDCTSSVHGYQADITRTFVFGADPTAEQRKLWDQVHRGQQIAIAAAKVGVPAGKVDDAVRKAYESWGYGPGYRLPGLSHRTGHGIGMEVHEPVYLVHGEMTPLAPGMCFSDEPGLYIPGKFGIRLEDCWHMTASGPKFFTQPPPSIDRPFG